MLLPRHTLLKRHEEFDRLSDEQKIERRLAWLERKVVEILWLLIGLTAMGIGALAAWFTHIFIAEHHIAISELWIVIPVGVVAWYAAGYWLNGTPSNGLLRISITLIPKRTPVAEANKAVAFVRSLVGKGYRANLGVKQDTGSIYLAHPRGTPRAPNLLLLPDGRVIGTDNRSALNRSNALRTGWTNYRAD
jgi:hypothetical protein